MKKKLFNSEIEILIRLLLILNSTTESKKLEEIIKIDYLTIYGKEFNLSKNNLHVKNAFSFTEYASLRFSFTESINYSIKKGYVNILFSEKGYLYQISDKGKKFTNRLSNEHAEKYLKNLKRAVSLSTISQMNVFDLLK